MLTDSLLIGMGVPRAFNRHLLTALNLIRGSTHSSSLSQVDRRLDSPHGLRLLVPAPQLLGISLFLLLLGVSRHHPLRELGANLQLQVGQGLRLLLVPTRLGVEVAEVADLGNNHLRLFLNRLPLLPLLRTEIDQTKDSIAPTNLPWVHTVSVAVLYIINDCLTKLLYDPQMAQY